MTGIFCQRIYPFIDTNLIPLGGKNQVRLEL
jgi:hypothetical protein